MAAAARPRTAHAGDILFSEAEPLANYASLSSGVVKLIRTLPDGRQQIVGLQFAPCLIGNFGQLTANVTVEAVGDISYCRIPCAALDERRADNPKLEAHLMSQLLGELEAAREAMLALGRKTARERVAGFILQMRAVRPQSDVVHLALTRTELADYLGLTLETVSRQFSALQRDGVITSTRQREIRIRDLARLEAVLGEGRI